MINENLPIGRFVMKSFRSLFSKPTNWRWALFVALVLALTVVSTVYASTAFDHTYNNNIGYTGPAYVTAGYQFTVRVTEMSSPQNHVCINYTVTTSGGSTNYDNACVCSGAACPLDIWTCTTLTHYSSAAIAWDISGHPGGSCTGTSAQGPTGNFTTGPTALVLTAFTAEKVDASTSSIRLLLALAGVVVLLLLVLMWTYRIRKNKLAVT